MYGRTHTLALALTATFTLAACEGMTGPDPVPPPSPQLTTLRIVTETLGLEDEERFIAGPEGYHWKLDDGGLEPIGLNDAVTLPSVQPGEHKVELTNVPEGCRVIGENPRSVNVNGGSRNAVVFEIDCGLVIR